MSRKTDTKPQPQGRPAIYFRLPQPTYDRLREVADAEGVTIAEAARMVLRDALRRKAA
jgi:hypothetical protein